MSLQLNLLAAWIGILLGFLSGLFMGLNFHREGWLGGYSSFKRRLYRLSHISLSALGALNLLFYLTARAVAAGGATLSVASTMFLIGAITMPVCCIIMAHFPRTRFLFAIPVANLIAGAVLVLAVVAKA